MNPLHSSHDLGRGHLGFAYRMLTLIIVWLALQIPLGALIGTFLERGMAQPRRREEARPGVASPYLPSLYPYPSASNLRPMWAVSMSALADRDGVPALSTREQRPGRRAT
jgi:hypothetical protein